VLYPSTGHFVQTEMMLRSRHSHRWRLRSTYHPVLRSLTHNALWVGRYPPLASTPLTCAPLAAVERLPCAAHLPAAFRFLLGLHLLAGHVTAEAGLDLGGGLVGLGVIQGDVHDVLLLLLRPAALLLLHTAPKGQGSGDTAHTHTHTHTHGVSAWLCLCLSMEGIIFLSFLLSKRRMKHSVGCSMGK